MNLNPKTLQKDAAVQGYVVEKQLVTALSLMEKLGRPLLLEGEAGVGKTEIAKVVASMTGRKLIRLQCYEGLDVNTAIYEWNYQKQLLAIRIMERQEMDVEEKEKHIFHPDFLLHRPLLEAIESEEPTVLLIDEVDRADEEFEAYLLELLSDFQITIPEIGTIKAKTIPLVFLTSNATREVSDALRRRCLYHYVDYPTPDREMQIIKLRLPNINLKLAQQVVDFVQKVRKQALRKKPGIAETLDWANALLALEVKDLSDDRSLILESLMCLIKTQEDRDLLQSGVAAIYLDEVS